MNPTTQTVPASKPKKIAPSKKAKAKQKTRTVVELQADIDAIKAKAPSSSSSSTVLEPEGFDTSFFRDLENTHPYGRVIFVGGAGTGKTRGAVDTCIGTYKMASCKKLVVVVDPESALHFLRPRFEAAGVPVRRMPSRTFADLARVFVDAAGVADAVIIDNISGYRDELIAAHKASTGASQLTPACWQLINSRWYSEFLQPLRRAPFHVFMTGREADIYEAVFDDEGRHESVKTGTKLRAGNDTAYEADLIVHMERVEVAVVDSKPVTVRRATVTKDRSDLIDGAVFDNPTFDSFKPAVAFKLKDGRPGTDFEEASTTGLLSGPAGSRHERRSLIGQIEAELSKLGDRRSAIVAAQRTAALNGSFQTSSWPTIELLDLEDLELGLDLLRGVMADGGRSLIIGRPQPMPADVVVAAVRDGLAAADADTLAGRNSALVAANTLASNLSEPHRSTAADLIKAAKKRWPSGTGGHAGSGAAPRRAPPTDS